MNVNEEERKQLMVSQCRRILPRSIRADMDIRCAHESTSMEMALARILTSASSLSS